MIPSAKAKLAAVIGWPVAHSLSPRLHGYWLERHGIDGAYVALAVAPEHFAQVLRSLPLMGFAGANVTIPHKEAALAAVDEADSVAKRMGAVNTVAVGENGSLVGSNTDGYGFMESLREGAPSWRPGGGPAVVLGAGGAARAVTVALADSGVEELRIVNRTAARAERLVDALGGRASGVPWAERADALAGAALLANTTSLGMEGEPPLELDLAELPLDAPVIDIVYSPLKTPLLAAAAQRGNPVVDGLGMLLHQAGPGFAAWFGVVPEVTQDLRAFVLEQPAGAARRC